MTAENSMKSSPTSNPPKLGEIWERNSSLFQNYPAQVRVEQIVTWLDRTTFVLYRHYPLLTPSETQISTIEAFRFLYHPAEPCEKQTSARENFTSTISWRRLQLWFTGRSGR